MSKYEPLGAFLRARAAEETPMRFEEIETVIGAPLPPKAQNHPAWWSNNPSNNTMTKVWLEAGYRTERVDVAGRKLVFRRAERPPTRSSSATKPPERNWVERLQSRLGGTVRYAEGFDPTAPTGEVWDAER
ncbi:MAG: DUF7662 domain-containing protein [Caulobacteraceae bacterium]